jgi:hypothetical protein
MGCGGSKEAVATGNTSAGSKVLRRKSSSVSTGASHTSTTSPSATGGVVTDVVKDAAAAGEVMTPADAEKPISVDPKADAIVVMDAKKEEGNNKVAVEEDLLPESTMADEALAVDEGPKVDEPLKIKDGEEKTVESQHIEEEHPMNEDGELASIPFQFLI